MNMNMNMNIGNVKPYWFFVTGMVVLLVFVLFAIADSGPWLGPGGTRRWRPWGPSGKHLIGPGGTRHLLGYSAEGFADQWAGRLNLNGYDSREGFLDAAPDATFTMFGVDWCPHCTAAKPEFERLGSTATIGGKSVACRYVNPEKDKQSAAGYQIDGYPTFYLEKGGQRTKYQGGRTTSAFEQWLAQNL